ALEHPAEIADRIVRDLRRTIPVTDPAGFNRFQAAGVRELTLYPLVELGNINPGRWRRMYEALQGLGLAKVPFDAERFIFNPERIEGERQRQARLWLGGALAVVLVLAGVGLLWLRALRRAVAERTAALREQTLRLVDSEARYRAFFDNSTECLIVFDVTPEGFVFRAANPPAQAALSLEEAALQGRRPADVMAPAAAERVGAAMARCVAERTAVRTEEHLDLPGGSRTWDTILVPLFAADGRIDRVLGSARDVTDRRHLEETLRQAQKMEALGQLTGGVAHDFNNLLTVISGNLHLAARRAQDDPRLTRWLGAAAQAAKRGEALTRQLLAFSRKQELVPQPTDLNARLADMAEGMLPRSLRGDIRIELELAADPAIVSVDPNQLELAVLNLAVNARDAMPNGGALRVATRNTAQGEVAAGDFVALTVSDTGTGMPPDVLARVFEPFFTTKEVGKGTGLGLSMVYGFVKQSGGTVRVTSTPGLGTVFTLFLPRAAAAAGPAEAESRDAAPAGHGTILLVEDNRDIAELTGSLLRDAGYQVLPAGSAAEALTIIHRGVPLDLVFSDIVMPGGLSGVDLAREVRRLRPDVPVLLTSGYSTNAEAAVQEGFPLLPKPYTPPALAKAIEQAMAGRQPAPELDQA
ncbi:MAG TPA: ATP-binding protein, partial [Alphaproteobacteria bacterium]|nr:ATP-binding protein [Alphaproteobacteria bacterium]